MFRKLIAFLLPRNSTEISVCPHFNICLYFNIKNMDAVLSLLSQRKRAVTFQLKTGLKSVTLRLNMQDILNAGASSTKMLTLLTLLFHKHFIYKQFFHKKFFLKQL